MSKVIEALTKLLPEDQANAIASSVEDMLKDAKTQLEAEYNSKLEEAFVSLTKELDDAKTTAMEGYQEAFNVIQALRTRLEVQRTEAEAALEEGYAEAYALLEAEKEKNNTLEVSLYEEYEKKLGEMREHFIDKIDEFMEYKTSELYEQARREIMNDPAYAEHRLTLDKVVETVAGYLSDEDYSAVVNSKLADVAKVADDLRGQVKVLEARCIRMGKDNRLLEEQVRKGRDLLSESKTTKVVEEKKERIEIAKKVQGSGQIVTEERVIAEPKDNTTVTKQQDSTTLVEGSAWKSEDELTNARKLAGLI